MEACCEIKLPHTQSQARYALRPAESFPFNRTGFLQKMDRLANRYD